MSLLDNRPNCQMFTLEHNHQYQQTEFKFLEAVESLNPQNIAVSQQASWGRGENGGGQLTVFKTRRESQGVLFIPKKLLVHGSLDSRMKGEASRTQGSLILEQCRTLLVWYPHLPGYNEPE